MGAHSLDGEALAPIRALAGEHHLTIVVGAGASVPSGLPNWTELVVALMSRSFREPDTEVVARKLIATQGLSLAAGAALGGGTNREKVRRVTGALYGGGRGSFAPSEMHRAVADLVQQRRSTGAQTKLLTTNYDDLLESALSEAGLGYRRRYTAVRPGGGGVMVEHLSGLLGQDGKESKKLLVTSADYAREIAQPASDWRMDTFTEGADLGPVLFVGTSLTDPLLLQYLNALKDGTTDRLAMFARLGFDLPTSLERRFETALRSQWDQFKVSLIVGDDYADSALLIRDIPFASRPDYHTPRERALKAWELLSNDFRNRQNEVERRLSRGVEALESCVGGEAMATLWLADGQGRLVRFGGSHRVYTEQCKLRVIPYSYTASQWVITRALADGLDSVRIADLDSPDSESGTPSRRWRSVAAAAIAADVDRLPRIIVGGLSVASAWPVESIDRVALDEGIRALAANLTDLLQEWIG